MVLLGSSVSGMSVSECTRAILQGVIDAQVVIGAVRGSDGDTDSISEIELIELYEDKALELIAEVPKLLDADEFWARFLFDGRLEKRSDALQRLRDEGRIRADTRRLDVTARGDVLSYALPGIQAAVPEMTRDIDIAEIRNYTSTVDRQTNTERSLGRVLFNQLLPLELKQFALEQYQLVLTLNESAASLPWELADADSGAPLSVQSGMIRQLRRVNYQPRERVTVNQALVIGEPVVEGLPELPGAVNEAKAVVAMLEAAGYEVTPLINPTAEEVRDELSRRPYRILHFAGHGIVDYSPPQTGPEGRKRTGMVIGSLAQVACDESKAPAQSSRGMSDERAPAAQPEELSARHWLLLTADDVRECVAQVPELVFINCCHLGKQARIALDKPLMAANFANSFMDIGCRAVVAAGWAVEDAAAQCFAENFYGSMVGNGDSFIDAVQRARARTYNKFGNSTATWGAYQTYGDPNYRAKLRGQESRPKEFCTERTLKYWLREKDTASMGIRGYPLEQLRTEVLEVIDKEFTLCRDVPSVFLAGVRACESVGAYEKAADLIQERISQRREMWNDMRVVHARTCLRIAMEAESDAERTKWSHAGETALRNLQMAAELENSCKLHLDVATLLKRVFLLQTSNANKLHILQRLVCSTRVAWGRIEEGIAKRGGAHPSPEELVDVLTDEQAQKTLLAMIVAQHIKPLDNDADLPAFIDIDAMRSHCEAKLAQSNGADEFWDDVDLADYRLLKLAMPPDQAEPRTRDNYVEELTEILKLYRFAADLSSKESERNSIAASLAFWREIANVFANSGEANTRHWQMLGEALGEAQTPWLPKFTLPLRPPGPFPTPSPDALSGTPSDRPPETVTKGIKRAIAMTAVPAVKSPAPSAKGKGK
jgi:hypothetical protein